MAGIDYTIPGQFKGIQLESPMNAMAQAMQLRNLQETSQMNALKAQEYGLKTQEYQRGVESRNKLARIHADPKVKIGSPEYLERVYTEVPDLYNDVATKIANRENILSQIETRETTANKSKFELDQAREKAERDAVDLRLKQFNDQFPVYNLKSDQDVEDRIVAMSNDEVLSPLLTRFGTLGDTIARNKAEFRRDPRNYIARTSGMSSEKIFQAIEEKENADYSQDQLNRAINKQPLISIEEWRNTRGQPQAASASAATTPTSANVAMPTAAATTTSDGDKELPNASFKGDVGGVDFLDPTAQALYTLASDPRNKDRASALRDMADKMQAEHVKRLEEDRKQNRLTGEFFNVPLARKKIQELRKLPATKENLTAIDDLLDLIKTAKEGNAPRVSNVIKMPPGPKAVDERYAQDYLDWSQGGGADAAANMGQIKSVLDRLASGEALTGKSVGLAPDFFNALVNPEALGAKQQVEEVVQRNLRAVLGAQFTQVEGERLISRAFDARLSPQENVKRLRKLFMQMQTAAQQKQAMAEYYEANETLRGYKGKQPKMQDFYDALSTPDAPPKGSVDVKGPDGKTYRFPDKKSADEFRKSAGIKE